MNKINKPRSLVSRLTAAVSTGSLVAAAAVYAPQTMAADAADMELKIHQMEESLRLMRQELDAVHAENEAVRAEQSVQRMDTLEERVTLVELSDEYVKKNKSMIFFRGGWSSMTSGSRANEVFSDLYNFGGNSNNLDDGWYIGAGIDHTLTEDLFGLWDGAELLGEINFQWTQWNSNRNAQRVVPTAAAVLGVNGDPNTLTGSNGVTLSQFTLSASPKIKFLPDSSIRPWIIPVGLDINVISPPSDAGTVLNAGMQFGGGVEWNFWSTMVIGTDVRYHWAPAINDTDTRYWQAGGYLGFQF